MSNCGLLPDGFCLQDVRWFVRICQGFSPGRFKRIKEKRDLKENLKNHYFDSYKTVYFQRVWDIVINNYFLSYIFYNTLNSSILTSF